MINKIFKNNNIYIGAVDIRKLDDDNMWEEYGEFPPSGLRFCFSNHERQLVIPFSVLHAIEDRAKKEDCLLTITQNGDIGCKSLYLYLNIDLSYWKIKEL